MRVALFLASFSHSKSRLKRGISELCAQLIDSFLGLIAFLSAWLLPNHFVVVDDGRAIIFLLVVKFCNLIGTGHLLVLKKLEVSPRLRGFLTFRIVEEEILERSFGVVRRSGVLCTSLFCSEPD